MKTDIRKNSRRAAESKKSWKKRGILYFVGRKGIVLLESSQASPARPSDKGSVEVKALGWLEVTA
jgi:hypothetical protein